MSVNVSRTAFDRVRVKSTAGWAVETRTGVRAATFETTSAAPSDVRFAGAIGAGRNGAVATGVVLEADQLPVSEVPVGAEVSEAVTDAGSDVIRTLISSVALRPELKKSRKHVTLPPSALQPDPRST